MMNRCLLVMICLSVLFVAAASGATPQDLYSSNVAKADTLFNDGSFGQAREFYRYATTFIRTNYSLFTPPPAEIYFRIGLCDLNMGENENAIRDFDAALHKDPGAPLGKSIRQKKGEALMNLGRFPEAEEELIASGIAAGDARSIISGFQRNNTRYGFGSITPEAPGVPVPNQSTGAGISSAPDVNNTLAGTDSAGTQGGAAPIEAGFSSLPATFLIMVLVIGVCTGLGFIVYSRRNRAGRVTGLEQRDHPDGQQSPAAPGPGTGPDPGLSRSAPPLPARQYDVFLCCSSPDTAIADAICSRLNEKKIRYWIAPGDDLQGEILPDAITAAIAQSRMMVLIFSAHTNTSPQVIREVTRAVTSGLVIIPFRIEKVPLSRAMEYLIGLPHWLDATTPPLDDHIGTLVRTIESILVRQEQDSS